MFTEFTAAFAILVIGFMFFGFKTKARIFYLAAAMINFLIAVTYTSEPLIMISLFGVGLTLLFFTFFGGDQ